MKITACDPHEKERIEKLEARVAELEALVTYYEEQIRLAKARQYGRSSEKTESPDQLGLFDEAESTADPKAEEKVTIEEITYKRKKRIGKRADDISDLPMETVVYELKGEEQTCPECGEPLHTMSSEERCEVEIIPAQFVAKRHVQRTYACRNCEKKNDHVPIITAPAPEPVLKNSLASPSAVAHIMVEKYVKAVPLYRQEQSFLRDGINLSRQTMANWIIKCAEQWLVPVYDRLREHLLAEGVLHADETVLQVINEPGRKAGANSYEWLYRTGGCAEHPVVLYEYQPTRSSSHPKRFLKDWKGFLHTDGYKGYHNLPDVTVVGCFAHVRRKFDEALKSMPADQRPGSAAAKGLDACNRLFELERQFSGLPPDERHNKRLDSSLPIAVALWEWAKSFKDNVSTLTKTAADYYAGQWPYLKNVFLDGRLELSNNRAERGIKPFVIGRKNWLFSSSQKGAKASSVVYSIIETAKENNLRPFKYLRLLFDTLPNSTVDNLDFLMPWSSSLPGACKCSVGGV